MVGAVSAAIRFQTIPVRGVVSQEEENGEAAVRWRGKTAEELLEEAERLLR